MTGPVTLCAAACLGVVLPASCLAGDEAAIAAYRKGDAAAAYRQYRALADADQSRPELARAAAATARAAGLLPEALEMRQTALALDPGDRWSRMRASRLLMMLGRPAHALRPSS